MGFDIGAVYKPQCCNPAAIGVLKLFFYKFHGIRQHGKHISCLKIVEGHMIVYAMPSVPQSFSRKRSHPRVMVPLPPGNHFPIPIISPDHDHIPGKFYITLLIQLHCFPIQIRTENGIRNVFSDQVILLFHDAADQFPSLLRRIILGIILPEGRVPLTPESKIPDNFMFLLSLNSFLPKPAE